VRLEGLGQLKNSATSGLEPATFQLVVPYLKQLRYRMPYSIFSTGKYFSLLYSIQTDTAVNAYGKYVGL
jgi:hypothetical protein